MYTLYTHCGAGVCDYPRTPLCPRARAHTQHTHTHTHTHTRTHTQTLAHAADAFTPLARARPGLPQEKTMQRDQWEAAMVELEVPVELPADWDVRHWPPPLARGTTDGQKLCTR